MPTVTSSLEKKKWTVQATAGSSPSLHAPSAINQKDCMLETSLFGSQLNYMEVQSIVRKQINQSTECMPLKNITSTQGTRSHCHVLSPTLHRHGGITSLYIIWQARECAKPSRDLTQAQEEGEEKGKRDVLILLFQCYSIYTKAYVTGENIHVWYTFHFVLLCFNEDSIHWFGKGRERCEIGTYQCS